ncbi:MAG: hypothetical protein QM817_36975 [Archangium sp.]
MTPVALSLMVLCAAPLKLATTGFQATGADPALARAWTERFAEVARRGGRVEVTTAADIEQLLGMQRQKALLGCDSVGNECLVEVASALGADGIIVGTVVKSESGFLATLRVLRGKSGQVWWSASERLGSEGALLDWLDRQAEVMVDAVAPRASSGNAGPLVLGGVGVAALATGVTLVVLSNTAALDQVHNADTAAKLSTAIETGKTQGTLGFIVGGVGVAALAGAVVWGLTSSSSAPKVAVVPLRDGAFVSVGGAW